MANKPFKKGDRVLCINDDFSNVSPREYKQCIFPVQGVEYTVRIAIPGSVFLEEIINPILESYNHEPSFFNFRFIKIKTGKKKSEKEEEKKQKKKSTLVPDLHP